LFFSTKYDIIKKNACSTAGTLPLRLHGMDSVGFAGGSCLKFRTLRMGRRLMISLFLVEDERIARESIRDNVPWQEHDILFLGDAPDGEVALPQLLEKRPDILLTDIKMPFMDGLELARIVRKELPDTRIIILSGHNEFEYARKAITLGVNDYLLKPVSSRDILEAVDRSKAQILECRARRIERQSYSITQRELFFSNLYSGILMGPAQMLQRAAQLGISLAAGAYQIILTELDGVIPDREALRDKLYAAPMAYGSGFDGERATFLLLAEDAAGLPPKLRE
ncbi:DNA replication protein DnaC, partial [Dysosmobacter welbionis]